MRDLNGTLIDGKYELVEVAGEGGMATVYKAAVRGAAGFTRQVAVKRIRPEFSRMKNYTDMFVEEARVGSELAHPNIVQVIDFCTDTGGAYYLVMEWIEGVDVGTMIKVHRDANTALAWPLVVAIGIGTLRGLGAAHDRRRPDGTPAPVIHRDVSPHNVLVGTNGVVKLTDFGLARARDRVYSLTAPGTVKGKLSYLAPEVTFGQGNSTQSDIFSMGAVLWECLTGERLFDGRNDMEIFKKIRTCKVPPLAELRPDVPQVLADAIERSLALDLKVRYQTAAEFGLALADAERLVPKGLDLQLAIGDSVRRVRGHIKPRPSFIDAATEVSDPPKHMPGDDSVTMEIQAAEMAADADEIQLDKPGRR